MAITNYAAVLDVVDAPDYVIGVLPIGTENPYTSTYNVDIPQYYYVASGFTWDGEYFISPYGEIVGVSPSGSCAVCEKDTGLVVNIIVASPSDIWPDPLTELIEVPFNVFVALGFIWNGTSFVDPNEAVVS